jgi:hypothetical protein
MNKEDAVTDNGLKYLCTGECKDTLTKLVIFCLSQVSENTIFFLLCNLPQLKILKHSKFGNAVAKYIDQYPCNELKIEEVEFDYGTHLNNQNLCNVLKNVKHLSIQSDEKLNVFHNLPHVEELTLHGLSYTFQGISSLFVKYSCKLTKLTLYNIIHCDFDVSFIGYYCKQLQELSWHTNWNPRINCKYEMTQEHFSELRVCSISCMELSISYFPPQVLKQMLASPKLEKIMITNLEIPQDILISLIEDARWVHNNVVFSNLTYLCLEMTEISVSCLKEIVCLAPKLQCLSIRNFRDRDHELYRFVRENGLEIVLS